MWTGRVALVMTLATVMLCPWLSACSSEDSQRADPSQSTFEDAAAKALRGAATAEATRGPDDFEQVQRFLIDCMRTAGFTYHPVRAPVTQGSALGLSDRQFKLKYGYGVSTLIDYRQAESSRTAEDPNTAELDGMSEAQRVAYWQARRECDRRIVIELGVIPPGPLILRSGSPLDRALKGAFEAAEADPRVAEISAKWAMCMRRQGFNYSRGEALGQELSMRAAPVQQAYLEQGRRLVDAGATWDRLKIADVLTPQQLEQLRQIQVVELAAAAADVACADQGIDVAEVSAKVQREYVSKALEGI
jgi:hypothetical protein